jgi:hypothetical protein
MKALTIGVLVTGVAVLASGCGCGRKTQAMKEAEAAAKQMAKAAEAFSKQAESGQQDMSKAVESMQKAMASQSKVELVDFRELKALLPADLAGLKRGEASGEKSGAMGFSVSKAEATYDNDQGASIDIEMTDMGGLNNFAAMAQFAWAMHEIDRETDRGYEKTSTFSGHKAYEEYDRENKSGKIQIMVKGRIMVEVRGSSVEMDAIKAAAKQIDLKKLEGLAK